VEGSSYGGFQVRVTIGGRPDPGVPVVWTFVGQSHARFSHVPPSDAYRAASVTNRAGVATSPPVVAGSPAPGWIEATLTDGKMTYWRLFSKLPPPHQFQLVVVGPDSETTLAGHRFPHPLEVRVVDAKTHKPVPNVSVTFTLQDDVFVTNQTTANTSTNTLGVAISPGVKARSGTYCSLDQATVPGAVVRWRMYSVIPGRIGGPPRC
jgi:DsbC/DsbD-like thiol-disulfide interchange protein